MVGYEVYRDGWGSLGEKERPGALARHLQAVAERHEARHGVQVDVMVVHSELVTEAQSVAPAGVTVGGSGGCLWGEVWAELGKREA